MGSVELGRGMGECGMKARDSYGMRAKDERVWHENEG